MRILILGGSGVISHYIVKKYRDMGHQVTVLNRGNRKELNIEGVEYVIGNANNRMELSAGTRNCFYDKILDFVTYDKEIMQMKMDVLQEKSNHYVFISSAAVYERKRGVKSYTEEMPLGNNKWIYGRKKSECEQALQEADWKQKNSHYTIIRPGITYGKMFIPYSPIDSYNMQGYLIHCILTGKAILTTDEGEDKMQVMHSSDFADNLYSLLNCEESRNECFNLCGDEYVTSNQILKGLSECLEVQAAACYIPRAEFMGKTAMEPIVEGGWHDVCSNERVKKILGASYHAEKRILDDLWKAVEFSLCHHEYTGWSKIAEKQILQVMEDVERKKKANIKYVSVNKVERKNSWAVLYNFLNNERLEKEALSEKRRSNEEYLAKWLRLEMKQIHLASYFEERGIKQFCLYGYGILGRQVIRALDELPIEIICVIDREKSSEEEKIPFRNSAAGLEDEYILVSVMSDAWAIVNALKKQGCKHIIDLGHVLGVLEQEHGGNQTDKGLIPYPELIKYQNIEGIKDLQLVNLGTGMGYYDLCYEGLPVHAFNFSMPQQSLEFDYKLIHYYKDKLSPGCKVCMVLSYCIFLANHIPEIDEINERYYSILPKEEVESRCNTVFEVYNRKYQKWKNFALETKETDKKGVQKCEVEESLNIWKKQLGILSFQGGLQRPEWYGEIAAAKGWFEKILLLCGERGWKPVVIVPPMSQTLLDRISTEFRRSNFYDILYEVAGEKILVLDYSKSGEFCDPGLYRTPCFLTKEGAQRFTRDVLKRLEML